MKIEVTREDINNGVPSNPWRCPIGLAISRALGIDDPDDGPGVDEYFIGNWKTPTEARLFQQAFDAGKPNLQPFTFDLEVY